MKLLLQIELSDSGTPRQAHLHAAKTMLERLILQPEKRLEPSHQQTPLRNNAGKLAGWWQVTP